MKRLTFYLITLLVTSVQAADRLPYTNAQAIDAKVEEEQRVWTASDDFELAINKSGQVHRSAEVNAYLQKIMDKLYPEFVGRIKVRAINSPQLNAFAIPNGNIYINMGLLVRCENEAQLATILAHEGAHFIYRHGYYQQQTVKSSTAFGTVTALLGVPIIGLLGNVIAANSIFGYSRELETEADNAGFKRLVAAGYDVSEASKVFEHLQKEVKISEIREDFFYSTHPKLQDRIDNFNKLANQENVLGAKNETEFASAARPLLLEDLELELSFGRYKQVIALLEDASVQKRYPPEWRYYLAEAYRKRNEKDDLEQSIKHLNDAIKELPDFAPSYRAKGLVMMTQAKNQDAQQLLNRYLELAPQAKDKSYIQSYLESLKTQP